MKYIDYQETENIGTNFFHICYQNTIFGDENKEMHLHWHNEMEIIRVLSGEMIFYIDGIEKKVKEGDILLLLPKVLHSGFSTNNSQCQLDSLMFGIGMLKSQGMDSCESRYINPLLSGEFVFPNIINKTYSFYDDLNNLISNIKILIENKNYAYEFSVKSQLFSLFFILFDNKLNKINTEFKRMNKKVDMLKDVIEYIEINYSTKITIEEASKSVNLSKFYFCKFFKNMTGISFIPYLNDYRLAKAANMIISSDESITDIAFKCGFESYSYFINLFKKKHLNTPLNYRKKYRIY